jgi:eukaryotic-like serine/threonine-protein kinase
LSTKPGKPNRDKRRADNSDEVLETLKLPRDATPIDETQLGADLSGPQTKSGSATSEASFLGNYAGLVEIGRGGMSIVYRAIQRDLGRTVAVKKLLAGGEADAELLSRFQNEAEAVAKLSHPNIVQIYQTGQTPQGPYFILEYVAGGTLRQKMSDGTLRHAEAAELIETIARAMEQAHQAGIIHRDLKPGNILLTKDGVPKVADFGLAKRLETPSVTRTGEIMGTPSYMAPEQAQGSTRTVTAAADIYALGSILYEMLTGRPPHRGADAMETVFQVVHEDPVTPRKLAGQIPVDLETICLKCLEKTPAKRYAAMQSLADDLRRYLNGEPIHAKPTPVAQRIQKWIHRYPGWAMVIAVSVLSATTIIAGSLLYLSILQVEKDTAERNLRFARDVIDRWCDVTLLEVQRSPTGISASQKRMAEDSIRFYEFYAKANEGRNDLRFEVLQTIRYLADLQLAIGDKDQAQRNYAQLRQKLDEEILKAPNGIKFLLERALVANQQAQLARDRLDADAAEKHFRAALNTYDQAFKLGDADVETQARRARTIYNYALLLIDRNDPAAEQLLTDALALHRKLAAARPGEKMHHLDAAFGLVGLARIEWARGETKKAIALFEESNAETLKYGLGGEDEVKPRELLATNHANLMTLTRNASELETAASHIQKAQTYISELQAAFPAIPRFAETHADLLQQEANLLGLQGKGNEGLGRLEAAERLISGLQTQYPKEKRYRIRQLELAASISFVLEEFVPLGPEQAARYNKKLEETEKLAKELFDTGLLSRKEVAEQRKWTIFQMQPKLAALLEPPKDAPKPAAP